jgi:lantibiotic modifying enzyme
MTKTDKKLFLDTAWKIGCQLMKSAIWHKESCNWQGYSVEPVNGQYIAVIKTSGSDIYSGTSGIAIFLSALYSEINDPILLKTIEGCVSQIKLNLDSLHDQGFYSGKPGIASALIKIGKNLDRKDWINDGLSLLNSISITSLHNHEVDVISGAAGTIPVLLDIYNEFGDKKLLDKAIALGDLLYNNAEKKEDIWSWETVPSQKNLTGFSHGASGIALALLQLYTTTKNSKYLQASVSGFNYERLSFDSLQQNWPDFRDDAIEYNACGTSWCHGAPGIAISRFRANQLVKDDIYIKEMNIALATTTTNVYNTLNANLSNTNFSLCHGIAGNSDILLDCGGEEHIKLATAVGVAGINKYQENNSSWPSGLNTNQYTPGLMMGLAGTGYFYMRLFNKEKYQSVLLSKL